MGLNTTGTANTNDYVIGRGIVRLARMDPVTGLPLGFLDLGNCPQFKINMTTEELKHYSSRRGLKVVDKRFTLSQEIAFTFQLDEVSQQNYATFFTGALSSVTNPAVAGIGTSMDKQTLAPSVEKGKWYIMRDEDTLVRASFANGTGVVVYNETTMMAVADTEYTLDPEAGLVFIHANAAGVTAGDELTFYSAAQAGAPAKIQTMAALEGSLADYALEFVQVNPGNNDEMRIYSFKSVSLAADSELDLISDAVALLSFKGTAQANAVSGETLEIITVGAV